MALTDVGKSLRVTADDGSRPITVAFDHELVSDVLHRVSWTGGYSNLFVIDASENLMTRASVMPPEASLDPDSAEKFSQDAVHADSTIGMLMATVRTARDGVAVQVRLPRTQADVSDVSEPEALPA
ncbi:hypothetical protein ACIQUC_13010 [Curtobacterium sp. NPDC098951]|uniref:hypothetical protein n=1 Tax=Curtobacterium sp. NPDC098951 TaxID=3363974 RepID=UPI00382E9854